MKTFTQRCTRYIEVPAMVEPYHIDSKLVPIDFELEFEYTECTLRAVLTIDAKNIMSPASEVIFQLYDDDLCGLHFSRIVMFRHPEFTPMHYCRGSASPETSLHETTKAHRAQIATQFIDAIFDNLPAERRYAPDKRLEIHSVICTTILQLADLMPSYEDAYRLHP